MSLLAVKTFYEIFCSPISDLSWENELLALMRVVIAGLLGLVIGFERTRRQKEAGLATHFIVAAASALFTCISTSLVSTVGVDGERIAAQVVSGVGFLGAGMIFFRRESLRGLTTAAGIWATAAIGMAVAVGQIIVAIGIVVVIVALQEILHLKRVKKRNNVHMILVKFYYDDEIMSKVLEYFHCDSFHRYKITKSDSAIIAEAVVYPQQKLTAYELSEFMSENSDILSIERLEDL
ncbi:MAG: MgtC/SapB family protein [Clostridiales bacterium]|nr:MgtC/SapB family protein [Clostridiales bacterium]